MVAWWIAALALLVGYAFGFEDGVNERKKKKKEYDDKRREQPEINQAILRLLFEPTDQDWLLKEQSFQ